MFKIYAMLVACGRLVTSSRISARRRVRRVVNAAQVERLEEKMLLSSNTLAAALGDRAAAQDSAPQTEAPVIQDAAAMDNAFTDQALLDQLNYPGGDTASITYKKKKVTFAFSGSSAGTNPDDGVVTLFFNVDVTNQKGKDSKVNVNKIGPQLANTGGQIEGILNQTSDIPVQVDNVNLDVPKPKFGNGTLTVEVSRRNPVSTTPHEDSLEVQRVDELSDTVAQVIVLATLDPSTTLEEVQDNTEIRAQVGSLSKTTYASRKGFDPSEVVVDDSVDIAIADQGGGKFLFTLQVKKIGSTTTPTNPTFSFRTEPAFVVQSPGVYEVAVTVGNVTPAEATNDTWTAVTQFALTGAANLDGTGGLQVSDFEVNQGVQPTTSPTLSSEPAGTVYIFQVKQKNVTPEMVTAWEFDTIPWVVLDEDPQTSEFRTVVYTQLGTSEAAFETALNTAASNPMQDGDNLNDLLYQTLTLHQEFYNEDAGITSSDATPISDGRFTLSVIVTSDTSPELITSYVTAEQPWVVTNTTPPTSSFYWVLTTPAGTTEAALETALNAAKNDPQQTGDNANKVLSESEDLHETQFGPNAGITMVDATSVDATHFSLTVVVMS